MACLDFYIKVLPAVCLFCLPCERRNRFVLRMVSAAAAAVLYSAAVAAIGITVISSAPYFLYMLGEYAALFIGVLLFERFIFRAPLPVLVFNLIGGYALHEIVMCLFIILCNAVPYFSAMPFDSFAYFGLQFVWFVIAYLIAYFFYIKKRDDEFYDYPDSNLAALYLSMGIVLFLTIFSIARNNYVERGTLMDYMCLTILTLVYVIILMLRSGQLELLRANQEKLLTQKVWKEKEKSLLLTQETVNSINIKYHDLKRLLSKLQTGEDVLNLTSEITRSLSSYENTFSTGNDTIDLILTEQALRFSQNGIDFSCMADGKLVNFMSNMDIISLFANAFDNAFEANLKVTPAEREVYFTLKESMGFISITMENPCASSVVLQNGLPVTNKSDKQYHGFGTRSILSVVRKFRGSMNITAENGRFILNILIPKNN